MVRIVRKVVDMIVKFFPFIEWFKGYTHGKFRIDLIAGITVALVLIPQSMAYAQLAGLPPYYGLYAAFLPPMLAALFGSSRQLATGPVAVVSLMTAASLEPLAPAGSEAFIAYAVMLALTVGVFQFSLGVLKLGLIVNFLSHPVVNGFTNAAAIIIASSQLSKMFGVYVDKAPHHYETILRVIEAAFDYTHLPTLFLGALAIGIMVGLKRLNPKIPYVLIAVVVTTLISWGIGLEHNSQVSVQKIHSPEVQRSISAFNQAITNISEAGDKRATITAKLNTLEKSADSPIEELLQLKYELSKIGYNISNYKAIAHQERTKLRSIQFAGVESPSGEFAFFPKKTGTAEGQTDGRVWRIKVSNKLLNTEDILMTGGGAVVGVIPKGLPTLSIPKLNISIFMQLLPYAIIISLLGFMEAIAIAKAMAAKTGQRLDPNQELIGQGLVEHFRLHRKKLSGFRFIFKKCRESSGRCINRVVQCGNQSGCRSDPSFFHAVFISFTASGFGGGHHDGSDRTDQFKRFCPCLAGPVV